MVEFGWLVDWLADWLIRYSSFAASMLLPKPSCCSFCFFSRRGDPPFSRVTFFDQRKKKRSVFSLLLVLVPLTPPVPVLLPDRYTPTSSVPARRLVSSPRPLKKSGGPSVRRMARFPYLIAFLSVKMSGPFWLFFASTQNSGARTVVESQKSRMKW